MRGKFAVLVLGLLALTFGSCCQAASGKQASPATAKPAVKKATQVTQVRPSPAPRGTNDVAYAESRLRGATHVSGVIHEKVVWTRAKSPYVVDGNLLVARDGMLTVEPGVLIRVVRLRGASVYQDEGVHIRCEGSLIARGTPSAMIRFTSDSSEPKKGQEWDGISLVGNTPKIITWTLVEYPRFGVDCNGSALIAHCVIRNCHTGIWLWQGFSGDVIHNVSTGNIYSGIRCNATGPEATIRNNICYENGDGIDAWNNAVPYADYNLYHQKRGEGGAFGHKTKPPHYAGIEPGPHDVIADPMFVSPEAGKYRLSAKSPARKAGYGGCDIGLFHDGWSAKAADSEVNKWLAGGARTLWCAGMDSERNSTPTARRKYEEALSKSVDPELRAKIMCSLGRICIAEGECGEAQVILKRAFATTKNLHLRDLARRYMAEAAAQLDRPNQAREILEQVEWAQSHMWVEPALARYTAMTGDVEGALRPLEALKKDDRNRYLRSLRTMVAGAIDAGQPDTAAQLMEGFRDFPICEELPALRLGLGELLREHKQSDKAVEILRASIDADPFSREATRTLFLTAEILMKDLRRTEDARTTLERLACDYYPSDPLVTRAMQQLGNKAAPRSRDKTVLLDASLMQSSIYDRGALGSNNFGQYEVARILHNAGLVVHTNEQPRREPLSAHIMNRYGLIIMNGRYGGDNKPPIPESTISDLVNCVENGGSLLVVAGGSVLGSGREAQFYNPLVGRFGLHFQEGVSLPYNRDPGKLADHPAVQGLKGLHPEHGVPVRIDTGEVLAYYADEPVIAVAQYGKGKVAVAGLGSGFCGQGMGIIGGRMPDDRPSAQMNRELLSRLVQYLLPTSP